MIVLTESKWLLRPWQQGCNVGPVTFIRRSADSPQIRAHEAEHARWFWRNPLFYGLMCWLSKEYHLQSEVAAYRAQIKAGAGTLECAHALVRHYGFDVTMAEALNLLNGWQG